MLFTGRRHRIAIILVACVGLAGCSSTDSAAGPVEEPATSAVATSVTTEEVDPGEPVITPADDAESSAAEPLRPTGGPPITAAPQVDTTSAYISRLSMSADTIEVNWSESEGVAEYRVHRIPRTSDVEPPVEAMTDDNVIHVTNAGGRFADEDVEAGTEYWHGVREFSAAGVLVAHGWHKTAAVDDEEPPSVVDGITAVFENGEVVVTWAEPEENYQLHGYRVLRGIDGEPSESIAVTWRLDQRSFIDEEPPISADVIYEVVAFDFHWNQSAPGGVTVDLT